jgi:[ribosomal protein S5]-alanine N-acetyltransferase
VTARPPALRFEPIGPRHLDAMAAAVVDGDVLRYTGFPDPPDPAFPAAWIARYVRGREAGERAAFAALDAADGTFLGSGMAPRIDAGGREMELGYLVVAAARNRGVGTAILHWLTGWAFAEGMLRLELRISPDNVGSQRVAEACGYVREGVLRSLHFKGDLREDTIIYSRLPSDPEPPR